MKITDQQQVTDTSPLAGFELASYKMDKNASIKIESYSFA
jgi:hypothetical protein